jgi:alkanesulfonate monooxygenase SsuD/methylene tetrahydromethanopterin reductase-like flavin-dependent oxidoreductase (luciferase family)
MTSSTLKPLLGISIDPSAADPQEPFRRARLADEQGIDLISFMDHPYNRKLYDTWTLLSAVAAITKRVRVGTNVISLPLRPPAMRAKQAASLDLLSGGRLELGLGAGAFWDGIAAYGGPRRTPGEAYGAFKDALHILQGMWQSDGRSFTYEGDYYQVRDAKPGPSPAHPIRLWVGASGPRMLRLIGRMAGGLIVSYNRIKPERLSELNSRIDEGAAEAGRDVSEIRRAYNLMGVLIEGGEESSYPDLEDDYIIAGAAEWVERIVEWYQNYRQDTFNFWPVAGDQPRQIEKFAKEVAPAVRERLGSS